MGFMQQQLAAARAGLDAEFAVIATAERLTPGTDAYREREKQFCSKAIVLSVLRRIATH